MKFCIQGLPRSILLLAFATIAACGGGTEPIASPPTPFIMASVPVPAKKASTVTGGNGVVIHMYQALYGMAPSNALLVDYAFQANNDASTFVKNLTDRFATTSHAVLAKLVLDNLGVTSTSVPAINAKGESEYALLLDAVKQIFAVYPTMRGQVILNMVNLLAGLETDVTYGAAAVAFNNQTFANYNSSMNDGVELFASTPLLLPDLRGKYDSLCGNPIAARVLPFADFNKDGKNDIIIYLACIIGSGSTPTNPKPVVNGVVVFLQQSNGTFRDGTRDLFGVDMLISDAIAVDGVVSDFNSDGYIDIVFSMNKEDGRPQPAGSTANNVQNAFITSNNDGSYTISRLGQYTWGAGVVLVDNEFGGSDVAFSPIGYGATNEAWRYSDGWHLLEGYEWVNYGTTFFKRDLATNNSHTAVTRSPYPSVGVDLYTRINGSPWTFRSSWTAASTVIPWINWFGEKLSTTMITLNGKDYVSAGFDKSCELKQYPNKKSIAIAIFQGYEVVGGYHGQELHESGDTGSLIEFSKVIGFTVIDGAISELNLNIRKGLNGRGFGVQCGDFDDDGYDDIMLTPWGPTAVPMIYLNDHVGGFDLVDSKKFPLPSLLYRDSVFKYEDIDGDGIRDLMFYPGNGMSEAFGKTPPVQYQIYKGLRKITKFDIQ